jgi:hypothetical protein
LDQAIPAELAAKLTRHAQGNFRQVVKDALDVERAMKASGKTAITPEIVKTVIDEDEDD